MNPNVPNTPQQDNDEVDLIRLLNYFKNGIKSFFRKIGKLFGLVILFILLLRKNWILVGILVVFGVVYGLFKKYQVSDSESQQYEFVLKGNSLSNMELYALGKEIKNNDTLSLSAGMKLAQGLSIKKMSIEPIVRDEDIINNYFEQIESNVFRGLMTDTLYYHAFDLKSHQSKMQEPDFALQKVNLTIKNGGKSVTKVQDELLGYLQNLPNVKREQNNRIKLLASYEHQIKRAVDNIDSLMVARTSANRNLTVAGNDQMMVNTANRTNVEKDLLEAYEMYAKKLYGIQNAKSTYENSYSVISSIHAVDESGALSNPLLRFPFIGFVLAALIVLVLQFNKYLNRYEKKNNI